MEFGKGVKIYLKENQLEKMVLKEKENERNGKGREKRERGKGEEKARE